MKHDNPRLARQTVCLELLAAGFRLSHISKKQIDELTKHMLAGAKGGNDLYWKRAKARRKYVFVLRKVHGWKFREIAKKLGVTTSRARELFKSAERQEERGKLFD